MRTIQYLNQTVSSLVIGNHEPVRLKVAGVSEISCLIHMIDHEMEIFVTGNVMISLRGVCKRLFLRRVEGSSTVDLSRLKIRELSCDFIGDSCTLNLDNVRMISYLHAEGDALIRMKRDPIMLTTCFMENARMLTSVRGNGEERLRN